MSSVWIYILVMALVSCLIRALPLALIRREIRNRFLRSVLYYLPYITLAVMTVPAILHISENPLCGIVALAASALTAWFSSNLFFSAIAACVAAYLVSIL